MRKRIRITLAALASIVVIACAVVALLYYYGLGDDWARKTIATTLAEMNIRTDVERVALSLRSDTLELDNIALFPGDDDRPFFAAEHVTIHFAITSFLAQTIELKSIDVRNPVVDVRFDEAGRSNLEAIKLPESKKPEPERDQIAWQAAIVTIAGGQIDYGDARHRIDGSVRNLRIGVEPSTADGGAQVARITAGFTDSRLVYDAREVDGIASELDAKVSRTGATIEKLAIESPLGTATLSGTLEDWKDPHYTLALASTVAIDRVGAIADPSAGLTGTGRLSGTVTGHGADYAFDGELAGDNVLAAGVRVARVSATGKLQGERLDYTWQGALIASRLSASGYDLSDVRYDGSVAGGGATPVLDGQLRVGNISGNGIAATGLSYAGTIRTGDQSAEGDVGLNSLVARTVRVGSVRAHVSATRDSIDVPEFKAIVYDGSVTGRATVRLGGGASTVKAEFQGVDVDQSVGAASPDAPKLAGRADGHLDLTWPGMRLQQATGSLTASIKGSIPSDAGGHPVDGDIALTAVPGKLHIDKAEFTSGNSRITAAGDLGWDRRADVTVTADAAEGSDLMALATAANPAIGDMFAERKVAIDGRFHFDGRISGMLTSPAIDGRVSIGRVTVNGEELGSFSASLARGATGVTLSDARVERSDGASIAFNLSLPAPPQKGQVVDATISRYPIVSLFNLTPLGASADLKAFGGMVSGHAQLTVPGEGKILDGLLGAVDLHVDGATLRDQALERLAVQLRFGEQRVEMPAFELATARGALKGRGTYDKASKAYRGAFDLANLDVKLIESMASSGDKPPPFAASGDVSGHLDVAGRSTSEGNVLTELNGRFTGDGIVIEREAIGAPELAIATAPDATGAPVATLSLSGDVRGHRRELSGQIFVAEEDQPFKVALALDGFDPLSLAGAPPEGVTTRMTGNVLVEGFLGDLSAEHGVLERLKIDGRFSELSLVADVDANGRQYRFANKGDVVFGIADNALRFEKATFLGDSTEVTLAGDFALAAPAVSNLTVSGDVNLELVTSLVRNVYATGSANVQATVGGPAGDPRFSGFADMKDVGLRAVDVPVAITNGDGRVVFTSNQALIESMTAQANGGRVVVDGGVLFEGLKPARWRFGIDARQVRMTYPQDVRSILDGDLTLQGNRQLQVLSGTVNLRRAEFTRDIDINDMLALDSKTSRASIPTGSSAARSPIRLDLNVEARDSILIRNNLADVAASASLVLTGAIDDPVIDGRATITRGTLDFRDNEYQINRGVVRFPGRLGGEITFDIQAESDIRGYRVTVGIAGTPNKTYPVLRSEPALTEPQIVSLILTGDIGSGEVSTQDLGAQGVNLASALLTEALSRSVEKRTGELFGINRFQLDPLVGGRNPSARVTIGRQVNKNLSILYSTNISSGEDQVIQLEYKLSNRFSLVASRDENGAYGLDIRVRKRF